MDDQKKHQLTQIIDKIKKSLEKSENNEKKEFKETKSMVFLKKYGHFEDKKL